MAEPVTIDPTIYGGEPLLNQEVPELVPGGRAGIAAKPYTPPEQVANEPAAESISAAVGTNAVAANNRILATTGEAASAAVKSWATTRVWDWINQPHFDVEPGFDVKPYINTAPISLSDEDHKFLAQSKSAAEFSYRLDNTMKQRELYQQMGDHPVLSTIVGMADPVYFAIDAASLGAGTLVTGLTGAARVGRITAGLTAAAGAVGVGRIEQTQVAKSDAEIVGNALLNGAAASMFFRAGKGLVKADPDYPSDTLGQAAAKLVDKDTGAERRVVAESRQVAESGNLPSQSLKQGEAQAAEDGARAAATQEARAKQAVNPETKLDEPPVELGDTPTHYTKGVADLASRGIKGDEPVVDAYTYLARHESDAELGPMIRTLRQEQGELLSKLNVVEGTLRDKQSFYSRSTHAAYIDPRDPRGAFTALHEVMHGMTAHKIDYGLANPQSVHGKIVQELDALRREVKSAYKNQLSSGTTLSSPADQFFVNYHVKNLHEFAAGLYGGKTSFVKVLSKIPAKGGNALIAMVGHVRKLLGLPPGQQSVLTRALGLTDELINTKLDVKLGAQGNHALLNFAPQPGGTGVQLRQNVSKLFDKENLGNKLSWSLHKTLSSMGTAGKKIADLLVDDPINLRNDSVVTQRQAIRSDLSTRQYAYEDALKEYMAEQGGGLMNRVLRPEETSALQRRIERQVYDELMRRDNSTRLGLPHDSTGVDPKIIKLADLHDQATAAGLTEMKKGNVLGADAVEGGSGYAPRKWSVTAQDDLLNELQKTGLTEKQARRAMRDFVADGIQRANPQWERGLAEDVAQAILERARRKGYFDDSVFRGHIGNGGVEEVRSILEATGIPADRLQRAIDVLTNVTDEAGKISALKHRVAIDMTHQADVGNGVFKSLTDLVDTNSARNLDQYLDNAAGQAALGRKGLVSTTDIANARREFLHGIEDVGERAQAANLFDNTIAAIKGNPVGEAVPQGLRNLQAATQMVGLAASGLWQVTEYATAAARYGMVKTFREVLRGLPVFGMMLGEVAQGGEAAQSLAHILARNSYQDIRIRPYLHRMEDNFETSLGDHVGMAVQQAKQVVPYLNAMRWVHHNQAKVVGNLVADTFYRAARGDAKAAKVLEQYGLEGHTLGSVSSDIQQHGINTELWSDGTWEKVRGPLAKMMDESVLRNRTGEIPAFAQFSTVGKFIFTFRSFLLGSHNKLLAGTLGRQGFGGLALLMAYQFPLTMAASAANSALRGKPESDPTKLAATAITQMSAMGLLGELFGVISGQKQQFGSSGLMLIDRLYKTGSQVSNGNFAQAGGSLASAIPLLAILPGLKAFSEQFK